MEKIFRSLFQVFITDRDDVLYIEDRRPTPLLLSSGLGAIGFIIFTVYQLIFVGFGAGLWVIVGMGTVGLILAGMAMSIIFREIYIFDRPTDTFTFTRQSVFKKDVVEGTLSQFRAVQVEKQHVRNTTNYNVVLLQQGPFLSGADTYILRENQPLVESLEAESKIATAISEFLKIERLDTLGDGRDDLTFIDISPNS